MRNTSGWKRGAAIALAACVMASGAWAIIGKLKEPVPAPGFQIKDVEGKSLSLEQYKGKVVLLMFWATWCGPCRMEIPHLIELQNEYGSKGLAVVSLSVDDPQRMNAANLASFTKSKNVNYRVGMATAQIVRDYGGVGSIPTSFLIDRKGNLQTKFIGVHGKEDFVREFTPLLPEDPAKKQNAKSPKQSSEPQSVKKRETPAQR